MGTIVRARLHVHGHLLMCVQVFVTPSQQTTLVSVMNGIVRTELGQNGTLETIHVCVRSAEKALIRPVMGLPLRKRMVCALHPNVLIYSSLKLNTAVNAPSDSITLCPHSSTDEVCVPLIKFENAIEMAKIRLREHHLWMLARVTATAFIDTRFH